MKFPIVRIVDANINRISEGLRVIEEYLRFVAGQKDLTFKLSKIRKKINITETDFVANLLYRDTDKDMRAREKPTKRMDIFILLKANFKRVEEGLRVLEEYTGNQLYNQLRYEMYELEKEILLKVIKKNIVPGIYLISDSVNILEFGLNQGVSLIQLRDKKASKTEYLKKALKVKKIVQKFQVPLIINDYLDIALLVDADGLHTGQDDLPIKELRKIFGEHKILGRTTHNFNQGQIAEKEGADYISIGPIWATPSKPGRPEIGFEYLKKAKKQINIPYVAIGGINLNNLAQVLKYQPPLIGLIRDYQNLPKIMKKFQAFL